jgi:deoxycytidylate deaminase
MKMFMGSEDFNPDNFNVEVMKFLVNKSKDLYTCNRPPGPTGALILPYKSKDLVIVAGASAPPGSFTCKEIGCEMVDGHCVRTTHAEVIAIALAASRGISTSNAIMFSVLKPCYNCSKVIVEAGIAKIYYAGSAYDEERTRNVLDNGLVRCEYIDVGLEYGNVHNS